MPSSGFLESISLFIFSKKGVAVPKKYKIKKFREKLAVKMRKQGKKLEMMSDIIRCVLLQPDAAKKKKNKFKKK